MITVLIYLTLGFTVIKEEILCMAGMQISKTEPKPSPIECSLACKAQAQYFLYGRKDTIGCNNPRGCSCVCVKEECLEAENHFQSDVLIMNADLYQIQTGE